jgi:NADPH2:quinone reductase
MTQSLPATGPQLRSLITADGRLELSLVDIPVVAPGPDEIVVRIQATPINPSDLGLLVGAADMSTARVEGDITVADVPAQGLRAMAGRLGEAMPVGNEGAGVVIAAGEGAAAQALIGKTVAILGGEMYARYRTLRADAALILPDDATAADGASCFVNPLTALCMVETMRAEGHKALVHTAAASNLGQMLNKLCLKDDVGLVNIVRSEAQARILRDLGAIHVVNSTSPDFMSDLTEALVTTGATLAFDAIGGGKLVGQILTGMEAAANRTATTYSRYGSSVHKQAYIYGALDTSPTELNRAFGLSWGVGGWLLTPRYAGLPAERRGALRQRVVAELKTTFASAYAGEISLKDVLKPEVIAVYNRRATGEKYLINPSLD